MTDSSDSRNLRDRAIHRLKAKQSFWYALATWVVLSVLFIIVWAVSGMGEFWPVWPIAGIGIGVAFAGIRAFGAGSGGLAESKIDGEMKRLS